MKRYDLIGVPGPEALLRVKQGSYFEVNHKVERPGHDRVVGINRVGGECWNIIPNDAGVDLSLKVNKPPEFTGRIALVSLYWGELHEGGYAGEVTIFEEGETKALSCEQ